MYSVFVKLCSLEILNSWLMYITISIHFSLFDTFFSCSGSISLSLFSVIVSDQDLSFWLLICFILCEGNKWAIRVQIPRETGEMWSQICLILHSLDSLGSLRISIPVLRSSSDSTHAFKFSMPLMLVIFRRAEIMMHFAVCHSPSWRIWKLRRIGLVLHGGKTKQPHRALCKLIWRNS